ncbi:MAG: PIN domain-containing protein [Methanobacterium sp. ERen5]|nr:MAG: PIN domain-containing protein [Methanobacterium sp. ERen5]
MMAFQFKVDVVGELKNIIPSCRLLVPSTVLYELEGIKKRSNGKNKIAASIALKIAKTPPIEVKEMKLQRGETVDDSLLRVSMRSKILCTNDRELRNRAREIGINVIYLRQRKYLDVDGHIKR